MKRIAGAAVAAAVLAGAVVATTAGGQAPQARTITLREVEKGTSFGLVDNPPRGARPSKPKFSLGDYFVLSSPLADTTGKRVGRLDVHCAVTGGKSYSKAPQLCHGAVTLADGLISLETSIVGEPKTVLAAVTGGTGAYAGARGQLTSVNQKGGAVDTIELLP